MGRVGEVYRYSLVIRSEAGRRKMFSAMLRTLKEEDVKRRAPWVSVVDINPYSFA